MHASKVFLLLIYLMRFIDIPAANILDCQNNLYCFILYICIILFLTFFSQHSFVFALVFGLANSNAYM